MLATAVTSFVFLFVFSLFSVCVPNYSLSVFLIFRTFQRCNKQSSGPAFET